MATAQVSGDNIHDGVVRIHKYTTAANSPEYTGDSCQGVDVFLLLLVRLWRGYKPCIYAWMFMISKNIKVGYTPAFLTKATKLVSIDVDGLGTAWNTWAASQGCQMYDSGHLSNHQCRFNLWVLSQHSFQEPQAGSPWSSQQHFLGPAGLRAELWPRCWHLAEPHAWLSRRDLSNATDYRNPAKTQLWVILGIAAIPPLALLPA